MTVGMYSFHEMPECLYDKNNQYLSLKADIVK